MPYPAAKVRNSRLASSNDAPPAVWTHIARRRLIVLSCFVVARYCGAALRICDQLLQFGKYVAGRKYVIRMVILDRIFRHLRESRVIRFQYNDHTPVSMDNLQSLNAIIIQTTQKYGDHTTTI